MSILGILAALLLPAVQSAREAARRAQCVSNLRQLGLGLQSYYTAYDMFPPGAITKATSRGGGQFQYSDFSPFLPLLPYIEQRPLFDAINFAFMGDDTAATPFLNNRTARRATIALLLCPSDGETRHRNNYQFNRGVLRKWQRNSGPFDSFFIATQASVTDGLSRTAFLSERLGGDYVPGSADPRRNFLYPAGGMNLHPVQTDDEFAVLCLSDPSDIWIATSGRYWFYLGYPFTNYNHAGLPNDPRPSCYSHTLHNYPPMGFAPPRSFHPGCVNVLFGDGHTEAVRDTIAENAWRSLGTPSSGD